MLRNQSQRRNRRAHKRSLDEDQFAAAYAFAASPARRALERQDWRAAAALEIKPAWFPWNRSRNVEALVHYARAIGAARVGVVAVAHRSADEIATIRKAMPPTCEYGWSGSIGARWEAGTALIVWAERKKDEGLRILRMAADHEDAVDKHPVTPGALLPVREMLADLLLENGSPDKSLKEYEAALKTAPRRFNTTADAAKTADRARHISRRRCLQTTVRSCGSSGWPTRWRRTGLPLSACCFVPHGTARVSFGRKTRTSRSQADHVVGVLDPRTVDVGILFDFHGELDVHAGGRNDRS